MNIKMNNAKNPTYPNHNCSNKDDHCCKWKSFPKESLQYSHKPWHMEVLKKKFLRKKNNLIKKSFADFKGLYD